MDGKINRWAARERERENKRMTLPLLKSFIIHTYMSSPTYSGVSDKGLAVGHQAVHGRLLVVLHKNESFPDASL